MERVGEDIGGNIRWNYRMRELEVPAGTLGAWPTCACGLRTEMFEQLALVSALPEHTAMF